MYSDVLKSIDGIGYLAIAALVLFIVLFAGIVIWTLRLDKEMVQRAARMPLDAVAKPEKGRHDR